MQSRWIRATGAALLGLLLAAAPALAVDLDGAKASGQVGEQVDGYVGLVKGNAPKAVQDLVRQVNDGRRKKYAAIASKNGIAVQAVAARAGAMLVERAAKGRWVKGSTGSWRQK